MSCSVTASSFLKSASAPPLAHKHASASAPTHGGAILETLKTMVSLGMFVFSCIIVLSTLVAGCIVPLSLRLGNRTALSPRPMADFLLPFMTFAMRILF